MIVGKKLIGIDIRKLMEFINILNVTDMAGIHKVRPHAGVGPGVVLALIKS